MNPNDAFSAPENHDTEKTKNMVRSESLGQLLPLKTTLETRKSDAVVAVYVTVVPVKTASGTLSLIRKLIPDDGGLDFQHLRRFAKITEVPDHVRTCLDTSAQPEGEPPRLLLIVGPVSAIFQQELTIALSATITDVKIFTVKVPLLAPTSQAQAKTWTTQYWPTVYKKSNPFGPHPSIVSRAEDDIHEEVGKWMDLAREVARETSEAGYGEKIGVVVVERIAGKGKVVAIAGDMRWRGCEIPKKGEGSGNVTAHAVMRVIGMVAGALRTRDEDLRRSIEVTSDLYDCSKSSRSEENDRTSVPNPGVENDARPNYTHELPRSLPIDEFPVCGGASAAAAATADANAMHEEPAKVSASDWTTTYSAPGINSDLDIFLDKPISKLEKENFDAYGNQNGYLCHDLEIYCTHEPCVMCSMAIIHSRFGRVVFQKKMTRTGGMCADNNLGHGLAWRKELNWTLLAWHWRTEVEDNDGELNA